MTDAEYRRHLIENAEQLASGRVTAEQFNDINRALEHVRMDAIRQSNLIEAYELGELDDEEFAAEAIRYGMVPEQIQETIARVTAEQTEVSCHGNGNCLRYRVSGDEAWHRTQTEAWEAHRKMTDEEFKSAGATRKR